MQRQDADFDGLDLQEFDECIDIVNEREPLTLITGAAGTGKTTLIRYMRRHFEQAATQRNMVVVAPTGVAALNADGETIHSFFRFKAAPATSFLKTIRADRSRADLFQALDLLVIDEISVVRADLFDAIDKSLRTQRQNPEPFGGVQVVVMGDMLQLPPIVETAERKIFGPGQRYATPFWFSAQCLRKDLTRPDGLPVREVLLEKPFRQSEPDFYRILNAIRMQEDLEWALETLNARCCRQPDEQQTVTLVPTNRLADNINRQRLAQLPGETRRYEAKLTGAFQRTNRRGPAPKSLALKVGAQVMMLRNDSQRRWVNGSMAEVVALAEDRVDIQIGGESHAVEPVTWEAYRHSYDAEQQHIGSELEGSYQQLPMTLAWGITIHKSQGATLDRMALDLSSGTFASGQVYVALSRCRWLAGLCLLQPLTTKDLRADPALLQYYRALAEA